MYFVEIDKKEGWEMFNLYENIKGLCQERGTTVSTMCLDIGVSKSLMSNLKNHRAGTLSAKSVQKIADYLGVSYDRNMHGPGLEADDAERDMLEQLRASHATRALLHSLRDMSEEEIRVYAEFVRNLRHAD